ncbi:Peroxisomal membrane signal receptor PTS1 [Microbotryomycetes sp. JL221]|nr:Peroxisomal membrane signal receptor PTS1 [Microbotryomycetes sp. JL221]
MSGAECSTSNTPLASLLKQQNQDHSLHQNQFTPQAGPTTAHTMRTQVGGGGPINADEAERFFNGGAPGPAGQQFANMDSLRRELESASRHTPPVGALKGDREWATQYQPGGTSMSPADMARMEEQFRMQQAPHSDMSAEFMRHQHQQAMHQMPSGSSGSAYSQQRPGFAPSYGPYGGGSSMGMMAMRPMVNNSMNYAPQLEQQVQGKGKGRFVELDDADWEAQFARVGEQDGSTETTKAEAKQETPEQRTERKTANLLEGDLDIDATEADAELMKSLEATWENLQSTLTNASLSDAELAKWEAQYGAKLDDDDDDYGFATPEIRKQWTKDNVDAFLNEEQPFPFNAENEYLTHPDPYAEGQRLLAEGAPLSEAALAFEAACKIDPSRAEAWKAAGETWAADEREVKGIRALEKAVACGGPDGIGAWMSLAVAYVNEGQELRALATLEKWLSIAYPTISAPQSSAQQSSPWDASNRVVDMFLSAARAGPMARAPGQSDELTDIDPDVQVGLGVLFYSNSDYERAKDCFEAALTVRPNDFLLWNRLGATLANGGLPEEAISAYRKALDLRPTFTRAIYNLGVSCLNIGCYHEAAEHLLAAIEGQRVRAQVNNGPGSNLPGELPVDEDGSANLWHTLRRAFLCMERHDLAERAQPGADVNTFRKDGFDF